jgi:hypothetical protein
MMEFWNSIEKSWDYHTMRNFNYFPLGGKNIKNGRRYLNFDLKLNIFSHYEKPLDEGEIIVGITARSILKFFEIPWNYLELFLEFLENLHKIPMEFSELLWNSFGITARLEISIISPSPLDV